MAYYQYTNLSLYYPSVRYAYQSLYQFIVFCANTFICYVFSLYLPILVLAWLPILTNPCTSMVPYTYPPLYLYQSGALYVPILVLAWYLYLPILVLAQCPILTHPCTSLVPYMCPSLTSLVPYAYPSICFLYLSIPIASICFL